MLRVVTVCAVLFACHLIVAADSDAEVDLPLRNESSVEESTSIQAEVESRADEEEVEEGEEGVEEEIEEGEVEEEGVEEGGVEEEVEVEDSDDNENQKELEVCLRPPDIDGVISPVSEREEYPVGAVVHYQCKFGHVSRSSGSLRSICQVDRVSGKAEWTHPNVTCIPRSCGDPGYVINARRIGNLFTFPNSVKFECLEGYKIKGLKDRYCQVNGEWSGKLPTCVPIQCSAPSHPKNGRVFFSSLDFGTELQYECDKGFRLQNHTPRHCTEAGTWSNDEPECVETICVVPKAPEHGSVQLSDKPKVGTLAFFSCNDGATLIGASTSKCLKSGDWTFDPPKCLSFCHVPVVQDGELGRLQQKSRYSTRHEFISLQIGESVKHNELVVIRCKDGYSPGNRTSGQFKDVTCNDGIWSEPLHCRSTLCSGEPPPTKNASPVISSREHGRSIWYRCDPGYQRVATGNVVCTYGKWEGITPVCADYRCHMKDLNYPGLVKSQMNHIYHLKHIVVSCSKGYDVSAWKRLISCFEGKWDVKENPCIIKSCEKDPPLLNNGQPKEFVRVNGSFVDYECNIGYQMVGYSSVHCVFGEWEGQPPSCQASPRNLAISKIDEPRNHATTAESLDLTQDSLNLEECYCTYEYKNDYLEIGLRGVEIESHEKVKKGEKVFVKCRYPNMDIVWPNGLRFYENIHLTCDTCQDWKIDQLPQCETRVPGDSFIVYNDQLKITPGGIIEVSKSERVRLACENPWLQPKWNVALTKKVSFQENPSPVRHTGTFREDFIIDKMDSEHVGRYECFATYYATKQRPVVVDLQMSGFEVLCPELSTEEDQEIFEIAYSNKRKVSSIASYKCKDPLKKIIGPNTKTCLENGQWTYHYMECEDIRCPLLNENNIFLINYSNNRKINSVAFYYCKNTRQRLIGSSNRTCLHSGQWSGKTPMCEDIKCPSFTTYNGLSVSYSRDRKVGSIASFSCSNHATLVGSLSTVCQHTGTWKDPKPSCENLVTCNLFDTLPNLNVLYSDGERVGSVARFQCLAPTTLIGSSSSRCLRNGSWSHAPPTCKVPNCIIDNLMISLPETVFPNMENITSDSVTPGSELQLICEDNLVLTGSAKALCNLRGQWEPSDTQCISACRVNKDGTSHLIVEPVKDYYRVGDFILLSCPPGQKLTNEVEKMMCLGKTWSDTLPSCTEMTETDISGFTQTTLKSR